MSGICGLCWPGHSVEASSLEPMLSALAWEGETEREAATARSAVLAVAKRWPSQQVAAANGILVAFQGELLNRAELEGLVDDANPQPPTMAQLIAHSYLRHGTEFIRLLDGDFCLALWDERMHRLVLAIDRLGVQSLYWRKERGQILFASRVGAVRAAQSDAAEAAPDALMQYLLFGAVPAPLTIYRGTEKLRPGHILVFEGDQTSSSQYWDLDYSESEEHTEKEWAQIVRQGLRSAVQRYLADCPAERTGAYLSGGTDSSSVVAFMSECISPVNTFTISFSEDQYSEVRFARTTAGRFRTRHHEFRLGPADALDAVPKISAYYDEPFANSSAIGSYFCARLAREAGVDVLLAGDGGDELFAGNERYASDKRFALYHAIPRSLRRGLIEPVTRVLPQNGAGWLSLPARYVHRAKVPNPRRMISYGLFLSAAPEQIFEPGFLEAAPPESWMRIAEEHYQVGNGRSELNRQLYWDVKTTLADNDLRKIMGTTDMAGVRARFPLLDYHLAELSGKIPSRLKLKGFQKRYIFKRAMKGILPDEVLFKKKHGFGVPIALWFLADRELNELAKDVLNDPRTRQRGYFRPGFIRRLLHLHESDDAKYYGEIIWYLVELELWHRLHLECRQERVLAH